MIADLALDATLAFFRRPVRTLLGLTILTGVCIAYLLDPDRQATTTAPRGDRQQEGAGQ